MVLQFTEFNPFFSTLMACNWATWAFSFVVLQILARDIVFATPVASDWPTRTHFLMLLHFALWDIRSASITTGCFSMHVAVPKASSTLKHTWNNSVWAYEFHVTIESACFQSECTTLERTYHRPIRAFCVYVLVHEAFWNQCAAVKDTVNLYMPVAEHRPYTAPELTGNYSIRADHFHVKGFIFCLKVLDPTTEVALYITAWTEISLCKCG